MRILHTLFSSGFAGTERATAEMCNACAAQGHEVMLALRRDHRGAGGASIRDHLDPRVQVMECGRWFPGPSLARAVREFRPEVHQADQGDRFWDRPSYCNNFLFRRRRP